MTSLKLTCYSCRILNRFLWPFAFIIRSGLSSCIRYTPPARMSFPPLWSSAPSWCVSPVSTYLCLPCVFSPCAPGPLLQFVFVTCVKHSSFFLVLVFLVFKSLHIFFLACLCPALLNFLPGCLPLSVPTWIFFIYWLVSVLCTWFQPSCVRFLSKTLIWKQKQMHFPLCCCHLQFHQGERWNYSPVGPIKCWHVRFCKLQTIWMSMFYTCK